MVLFCLWWNQMACQWEQLEYVVSTHLLLKIFYLELLFRWHLANDFSTATPSNGRYTKPICDLQTSGLILQLDAIVSRLLMTRVDLNFNYKKKEFEEFTFIHLTNIAPKLDRDLINGTRTLRLQQFKVENNLKNMIRYTKIAKYT